MKFSLLALMILSSLSVFAGENNGFFCKSTKTPGVYPGFTFSSAISIYHPASSMWVDGKIKDEATGKVSEFRHYYLCDAKFVGRDLAKIQVECRSTDKEGATISYFLSPTKAGTPTEFLIAHPLEEEFGGKEKFVFNFFECKLGDIDQSIAKVKKFN